MLTVAAAENSGAPPGPSGRPMRTVVTMASTALLMRVVSGAERAPDRSGARRAIAGVASGVVKPVRSDRLVAVTDRKVVGDSTSPDGASVRSMEPETSV